MDSRQCPVALLDASVSEEAVKNNNKEHPGQVDDATRRWGWWFHGTHSIQWITTSHRLWLLPLPASAESTMRHGISSSCTNLGNWISIMDSFTSTILLPRDGELGCQPAERLLLWLIITRAKIGIFGRSSRELSVMSAGNGAPVNTLRRWMARRDAHGDGPPWTFNCYYFGVNRLIKLSHWIRDDVSKLHG